MSETEVYVLWEGTQSVRLIDVDGEIDLLSLKDKIFESGIYENRLSYEKLDGISFFRINDRNKEVDVDTQVKDLNTSSKDPLILQHVISEHLVVVNLTISSGKKWTSFLPHSSGLFYQICDKANKELHFYIEGSDFYYLLEDGKKDRIILSDDMMYKTTSKLLKEGKTEINLIFKYKDCKPYREWTLAEVSSKFLNMEIKTVLNMEKFKAGIFRVCGDELGIKDIKIKDETMDLLIGGLNRDLTIMHLETDSNEATRRIFINPFLSSAVYHLEQPKEKLSLQVQEELIGPYGHGPLDYSIVSKNVIVTVAEVKNGDFEQEVAENIVQMSLAVEKLGAALRKRKRNDDSIKIPVMYGIVTNALEWRFLRWVSSAQPNKNPKIQISKEYKCFSGTRDIKAEAEEILKVIIGIIQHQTKNFELLESELEEDGDGDGWQWV